MTGVKQVTSRFSMTDMALSMKRFFVVTLLACLLYPRTAASQEATRLHRIDAKTPEGLRELLRYDGNAMPLLSAHRGGAVPGYPENCLATFDHTLGHAFSMLEIDLRFSKDGEIVLHHDATLDRTTSGTGPLSDRTLQELRQLRLKDSEGQLTDYSMPTLDEALEWARGKTIVILDKKDVPVDVCVKKIQQHHAHAYAMVMAYSVKEIQACYQLDPDIMMEVMIGDPKRLSEFEGAGVPWNRVIAFVGHAPPNDQTLLSQIHSRGTLCMAGTSRNLDRRLIGAGDASLVELRLEYQQRIDFGVDLLETDLPVQVAGLLYSEARTAGDKARFFQVPSP